MARSSSRRTSTDDVELESLEAKVEAEIGCDEARAKSEGQLLHDHELIEVNVFGKIHFELPSSTARPSSTSSPSSTPTSSSIVQARRH